MYPKERSQELMIVKDIHEKCLSKYLTKQQTIEILYYYEPKTVLKVWEKLESENPKYFEAYNMRLWIKSQIEFYNDVNYLLKENELYQQKSEICLTPAKKCERHIKTNKNLCHELN